jgi:hypothetical protein
LRHLSVIPGRTGSGVSIGSELVRVASRSTMTARDAGTAWPHTSEIEVESRAAVNWIFMVKRIA